MLVDQDDQTVIDRVYQAGVMVAQALGVETDPDTVRRLHRILKELDITTTECRRCPYRVECNG